MKKLIFITIMLFSSLVFAYEEVDLYSPPRVSGEYYIIAPYSMSYDTGDDIGFTTWDNPYDDITCHIINRRYLYDKNRCSKFGDVCYEYKLDCTVSKRIQFYRDNVTYYTLRGYRYDGTLKWSRNETGSNDIYCYDKSGMTLIKRVNDPYYCK